MMYVHNRTPLTPLQKIKKEITSYLEYPSMEPDTNPLEWWKLENGRFPIWLIWLKNTFVFVVLAYLPREFLVKPAT